MEATTVLRVLLSTLLLAAGQSSFAPSLSSGGGGFSVEFIHRDSVHSPFHDPALSPHARMLAAARRSLASGTSGGVVAEVFPHSFEYLMSVSLGTPPRQMLAIADTGSDLVWVDCPGNHSTGNHSTTASSKNVFDPSKSSTYGVVRCGSDACRSLQASCDAHSRCQYLYLYGDWSVTVGVLSTETFTFRAGGGGATHVPKVRFGCSSFSAGSPGPNGIVGLGGGVVSLVSQLGAAIPSIGRRFSYCLVPYADGNASSALNFGARTVVSDPGAASTPLVPSDDPAHYTVELQSVSVGGQTVATKSSRVIVDSGTTLTFLDQALVGPLVKELEGRVKLPRTQSPEQLLDLCYDVHGKEDATDWGIPDVTLRFGGGAAVTLKTMNMFVLIQEGTLCLAVVAVSDQQSMSILGNLAQQDFHVGYDLDKGTITFAPASCAASKVSSH
jgi:hypothetical protein